MRYTNKEGNTLNLNEAMAADIFLMEADLDIRKSLFDVFQRKKRAKSRKETEGRSSTSS